MAQYDVEFDNSKKKYKKTKAKTKLFSDGAQWWPLPALPLLLWLQPLLFPGNFIFVIIDHHHLYHFHQFS